MSGGRAAPAIALAAGALLGCAAGGVSLEELPEHPIAVVHREPEEARNRREALRELLDPERSQSAEGDLVVSVDEARRFLDWLSGEDASSGAELSRRFPGRLALLDPRSGRVEPLGAARKGAIPTAWSPDHRRLLFAQLVDEQLQLFEYDREKRSVRRVTRGPEVHPRGCYGPEGRYVWMQVTVEGRQPRGRMLLTGPGGVRARPISEGPIDQSPACAPDGSAVAWVAREGRRDWIVVRKPVPDGENRRLAPGRDPDFSPDGQWIVYSARVGDGWRLYRMRPDGSARAPLGRGVLDAEHPRVSPDGGFVLYAAEEDFHTRLYLRRFDGTGDRLLGLEGEGERPVW